LNLGLAARAAKRGCLSECLLEEPAERALPFEPSELCLGTFHQSQGKGTQNTRKKRKPKLGLSGRRTWDLPSIVRKRNVKHQKNQTWNLVVAVRKNAVS